MFEQKSKFLKNMFEKSIIFFKIFVVFYCKFRLQKKERKKKEKKTNPNQLTLHVGFICPS